MTIVANELRTKGVKALNDALKDEDEAYISIRGKPEYVVIKAEKYEKLKELELDIAYLEAIHDLENGDYTTETAKAHIESLRNALRDR